MVDDDICECWAWSAQQPGDYTAPYTLDSAAGTITIDGGAGEYCVDGTTLSIRFNGATVDESVLVLQAG